MAEANFEIPYTPRFYQRALETALDGGIRRACLTWARQHGKDFACWNYMILKALETRGVYFYIFPEYSHGKRVIWNGLTLDGRRYRDQIPVGLIAHQSNSEMSIELINGSRLQVVGSSNYDALRGVALKGAVLSEYAYQSPNVWDLVLDPVFSNEMNKDAWAIFNSTPQGRNHFYELFEYAKAHPETWYSSIITNDDTKLVSLDAISQKRARGMSEEKIQQEYYCSFDAGVEGAIYARLLQSADREGRVGFVPYDPNFLVYTAWDIGIGDATSIIWYQRVGGQAINIIDCYENTGYAALHYFQEVKAKKYEYGSHFFPHDARARDKQTGINYIRSAQELGLNAIAIDNTVGLEEGIERVRGAFHRLFFDKQKTQYLRRCLQQYHYDYDDKAMVHRSVPKHDWSSHCADALRMLVLSLDSAGPNVGMTPDALRKLRADNGVMKAA